MDAGVATLEHAIPGPERIVSLDEIRRDPLGFVARLVADHGDVVRYRTEDWTTILLNDPAHVRHALQDNFRNYTKEGTPDLLMLEPMLGKGLLTTSGAEWRRQRRMVAPAFHPAKVRDYAAGIVSLADRVFGTWCDDDATARLDLVDQMTRLTLRAVSVALFGYDLGARAEPFGRAVETMNAVMGGGEEADEGWRDALGTIRRSTARVILNGDTPDDGLLSRIPRHCGVSDRARAASSPAVVDQVLTLLLAGHETTAKVLSWTMQFLCRDADVLGRLREEVDRVLGDRSPTAEDCEHMPYGWAVLRESMRLRPPIWLMTRRAIAPDEIGGFAIAPGALLAFSPYLLHRRPDIWDAPETFRPERFLGDAGAERDAFAYMPFSAGPRHCVGQHFAMLEMRLILPLMVRDFDLALIDDAPTEPEALVTLRPRGGLAMRVRRRWSGS